MPQKAAGTAAFSVAHSWVLGDLSYGVAQYESRCTQRDA